MFTTKRTISNLFYNQQTNRSNSETNLRSPDNEDGKSGNLRGEMKNLASSGETQNELMKGCQLWTGYRSNQHRKYRGDPSGSNQPNYPYFHNYRSNHHSKPYKNLFNHNLESRTWDISGNGRHKEKKSMMEKSWIEVKICFYFLRISCEEKPFVKSVKLNVTSLRSQSTWESISLISSINVMLLGTMFLTRVMNVINGFVWYSYCHKSWKIDRLIILFDYPYLFF